MALDPAGIFRGLGFSDGDGCLTRTFSSARDRSVVEVRDAATGRAPEASAARLTVRLVNPDLSADWRGPLALELRDAALADAVALVVADANAMVTADGDVPREELTFVDAGMCYTNAFADDQYADWVGDMETASRVYVLRDPRLAYGAVYESWRDSVLALAVSGELGRMIDGPAPVPAR